MTRCRRQADGRQLSGLAGERPPRVNSMPRKGLLRAATTRKIPHYTLQ